VLFDCVNMVVLLGEEKEGVGLDAREQKTNSPVYLWVGRVPTFWTHVAFTLYMLTHAQT